eukprot:gene28899-35850_t
MSWTIVGQLCSERGNKIWWRVIENYRVFALVSLGVWTDEAVRDFEIKSQFKKQEQESTNVELSVTSRLGTIAGETSAPGELLRAGTSSIFDTSDDCDDRRLKLISALVSTRVVLIQLIPYMTIYSTLAVDISSSPIFIYSPFLNDKVSPLF